MGGGSWARGKDPDDVAKRAVGIFYADWKSLFDLSGKDVSVDVYDVTGHDKVTWDAACIYGDNHEAKITKLENRTLRFPKGKR
jgi:hypothetical protein